MHIFEEQIVCYLIFLVWFLSINVRGHVRKLKKKLSTNARKRKLFKGRYSMLLFHILGNCCILYIGLSFAVMTCYMTLNRFIFIAKKHT